MAGRGPQHFDILVIDQGGICRHEGVTRARGDVMDGVGQDITDMYT